MSAKLAIGRELPQEIDDLISSHITGCLCSENYLGQTRQLCTHIDGPDLAYHGSSEHSHHLLAPMANSSIRFARIIDNVDSLFGTSEINWDTYDSLSTSDYSGSEPGHLDFADSTSSSDQRNDSHITLLDEALEVESSYRRHRRQRQKKARRLIKSSNETLEVESHYHPAHQMTADDLLRDITASSQIPLIMPWDEGFVPSDGD